MRRWAVLCLLAALSLALATAGWADDQLRRAELGRCELESGAFIEDCSVGFRVLGALNADRSNILVFPSWYDGSTASLLESGLIGPGALADTDRYHVIAIDAFGNGVSSSPSNSEKQPGNSFPRFTIGDMVTAQHRLLTGHLGHERIFAVLGVSMGGFQALEWAVRHPDFAQKIVSIEGTPWPTAYDLLLWQTWRDASGVYRGDEASLALATELITRLDALTLWSPGHFTGMVQPAELDRFMEGFSPPPSQGWLLDRRSQTDAVLAHDIRRGLTAPETDLQSIIKSDIQVVVFNDDHMVNPQPSLELARWIGADARLLDTACGHMGPTAECVLAEVHDAVRSFLQKTEH